MPTSYGGQTVSPNVVIQSANKLAIDNDSNKAYPVPAVNPQTGTSYSPVLADVGKVVTLSNAGAITLTFLQDSAEAAAIPVGAVITFEQHGAGLVTAAAGSGATVNKKGGSLAFAGQWSVVRARKRAANTWLLSGDLA